MVKHVRIVRLIVEHARIVGMEHVMVMNLARIVLPIVAIVRIQNIVEMPFVIMVKHAIHVRMIVGPVMMYAVMVFVEAQNHVVYVLMIVEHVRKYALLSTNMDSWKEQNVY
jgi:hypothetical protein